MTRNKLLLFSLTLLTTLPLSVRAEETSTFMEGVKSVSGIVAVVTLIVGVFVAAALSEVSWDFEILTILGLCFVAGLFFLSIYLSI